MSKVYLVGAGCGDPALLTLKGKLCIEQADVIYYDRLLDPTLLQYAKQTCTCIYVGKEHHHHTLPQTKINEALIKQAQQGKLVVRLKGGDPFVFGRGGEEAIALRQAGIPFEVVPGIPSAIGGLAYAGIPVTHRGITKGFRVYTAHDKTNDCITFAKDELKDNEDTLIFLMGLSNVKKIAQTLDHAGKAKQTPVAICSHLSMPSQRCIETTLGQLATITLDHLCSPAIIVVGEVVNLRQDLNFYEQLPLFQTRYILMKVQEEPHRAAISLREAGAEVLEIPCAQKEEIAHVWTKEQFASYTHIIFTSATAVHVWMKQLFASKLDVRSLAKMKVAAMGKHTQETLQQYGICTDLIPEEYNSPSMAKCLLEDITKQSHILLPKADNDNTWLQDTLMQECSVDCIPIYRMKEIEVVLPTQPYDGVLLTCATSARQFAKYYHGEKEITLYVIGNHTKQVCVQAGFHHITMLPKAEMEQFASTIIKEMTICIAEED